MISWLCLACESIYTRAVEVTKRPVLDKVLGAPSAQNDISKRSHGTVGLGLGGDKCFWLSISAAKLKTKELRRKRVAVLVTYVK